MNAKRDDEGFPLIETDLRAAYRDRVIDLALQAFRESRLALWKIHVELERIEAHFAYGYLLRGLHDAIDQAPPRKGPPKFIKLLSVAPEAWNVEDAQQTLVESTRHFFQDTYSMMGALVHLQVVASDNPERDQIPRRSVKRWLEYVRRRHPDLARETLELELARFFRSAFIAHPLDLPGAYNWFTVAAPTEDGDFVFVPIFFNVSKEDFLAWNDPQVPQNDSLETGPISPGEELVDNPYLPGFHPWLHRVTTWAAPPRYKAVWNSLDRVSEKILEPLGITKSKTERRARDRRQIKVGMGESQPRE